MITCAWLLWMGMARAAAGVDEWNLDACIYARLRAARARLQLRHMNGAQFGCLNKPRTARWGQGPGFAASKSGRAGSKYLRSEGIRIPAGAGGLAGLLTYAGRFVARQ